MLAEQVAALAGARIESARIENGWMTFDLERGGRISVQWVAAMVSLPAEPGSDLGEYARFADTDEERAALARMLPYLSGYPEPMIDSRRLRIANGTASEDDRRSVAVDDRIIKRLRAVGIVPVKSRG